MDFMFFFSDSSSGDFNYAAVFSLFGVVITAIFSIRVVLINIKSRNVDEERIKWRESIRVISNNLVSLAEEEKRKLAYNELVMRLNPSDEYDRELIQRARDIVYGRGDKDCFIKYISLMMKYDWERCKLESRFFKVFYKLNVDGRGELTKNIIKKRNTNVEVNIVKKGCGIILYHLFIFCSVVISIVSTVMYFQ